MKVTEQGEDNDRDVWDILKDDLDYPAGEWCAVRARGRVKFVANHPRADDIK